MTQNENNDEIRDNYNVISFSGFYYIRIVIGESLKIRNDCYYSFVN